jgi:23S rRNA pseudouridine1911/1915/1917 synthase
MGCTIKGDLKYGTQKANEDASIHLHARRLELEHPVKKEPMVFTANVPSENLWQEFAKMMK